MTAFVAGVGWLFAGLFALIGWAYLIRPRGDDEPPDQMSSRWQREQLDAETRRNNA